MTLSSFKDISESTLTTLVEQDSMTCEEVDLLTACVRWAHSEAKRRRIAPQPEALRDILSNILPQIRFLAMTPTQFTKDVKNTKLLTNDEMLPILLNLNVKNSEPLPPNLCKVKEARSVPIIESFYVFGSIPSNVDPSRLLTRTTKVLTQATQRFAENDIIIGVRIPTQVKQLAENEPKTYDEHLTVFVIDQKEKTIVAKTEVKRKVQYNDDNLNVKLPPYKITRYNQKLHFRVAFHKTGRYPGNKIGLTKTTRLETTFYEQEAMQVQNPDYCYIHTIIFTQEAESSSDSHVFSSDDVSFSDDDST